MQLVASQHCSVQRTAARVQSAAQRQPGTASWTAVRPFTVSRTAWKLQRRSIVALAEPEQEQTSTSQPFLIKMRATARAASKPEDEPIWVRRERERELQAKEGKDLPFGVYLLLSAIVAIAAVGSIFEYTNKNAIFEVVQPDSPLYAPILGIFVFTGFPSAGYLFYKAVQSANKASEQMDKLDGY